MGRRGPKRPVRAVGAFMGPNIMVGVPTSTLSDEYRDEPAEPEDDQVPEPESPGAIRRLADALTRRLHGIR